MIDKKYVKIMKDIHNSGWKSAVIGGGLVRDAFLKKPHKDVDIFLFDPLFSGETPFIPQHDKIAMFVSMGLVDDDQEFTLTPNDGYYNSQRTKYITNVWTLETDFDVFQLIFLEIPPIEYVTKYFDVGICMCYFDGIKVRYTHEFLTDFNNKTLTICGRMSEQEFLKTLRGHVRSLRKKLPGFKVKVAPHLQQYVTTTIQAHINKLNS